MIDNAIQILRLRIGTLLAKIDILSTFRLLPVHPKNHHLLGMSWTDDIYINSCLSFGFCSSPKLFNVMADLLAWILQQQGVIELFHYLNNFLTIGPPMSVRCQDLDTIQTVCTQLGVPLAVGKVEGHTTSLYFLGITINTTKM